MYILLFLTDTNPSWNLAERREWLKKNISWSISMKVWDWAGIKFNNPLICNQSHYWLRYGARSDLGPNYLQRLACKPIWTDQTESVLYTFMRNRNCDGGRLAPVLSTLDKQRICVNTQLKSSKKQLKWKVCVPKSNSNERYAITCDVIAYCLVHFVSMPLRYWFFFQASAQYNSSLWIKYRYPVKYFAEKHYDESETLQSVHAQMSTRRWDLLQVQ